ncbi:30S ribosomal protein S16 [Alphaproteobacteria bacterium]|nr:30S ribosomal protein S16 [Alphaproteobacteria bacterium]
MALKIRLSRGGTKKRPFYRIVVAEAASPRDGKYVERVGHYNPMVPKEHDNRLSVSAERVKFWMGQGAKPTDRVHKLLAIADILEAPVITEKPKKSAFGKKRTEREAEAAEAKTAADAAAAEAAAAEAAAAEAAAAVEETPVEAASEEATENPAETPAETPAEAAAEAGEETETKE